MKCPKCGNELRKGLSFCPKCGEIITDSSTGKNESKNSNVEKKKKPAWLIVLAVLFFPISLTYLAIKSKMKTSVKIILICLLWVFVIAVGGSGGSQNTNTGTESQNENNESFEKQEVSSDDVESEEAVEPAEEPQETVRYHPNEEINQLFISYNAIAAIPVVPEEVVNQDKIYNDRAIVTIDDVRIRVINNGKALLIDFEDEAPSDEHIYSVIRDFVKTMVPTLTDEEIQTAWEALQTGEYEYYSKYNLGGINISYNAWKLDNGDGFRYKISTELYI